MRIREGFELVRVVGEWIVVPIGKNMLAVNGVLKLTESGVFLWGKLTEERGIDELVSSLRIEYGIENKTAEQDVHDFVEELYRLGLLNELRIE